MKRIYIILIAILLLAMPVYAEDELDGELDEEPTAEDQMQEDEPPLEDDPLTDDDLADEPQIDVDEFDFKRDVVPLVVTFSASLSAFSGIIYILLKSLSALKSQFKAAKGDYEAVALKVIESQGVISDIKTRTENAIKELASGNISAIKAFVDENKSEFAALHTQLTDVVGIVRSYQESAGAELTALASEVSEKISNIQGETQAAIEAAQSKTADSFNAVLESAKADAVKATEDFERLMQVLKVAFGNNAELAKSGYAEVIYSLIDAKEE